MIILHETRSERYAALVEMVRKHAPLLMRAGGLVANQGHMSPPVTAEQRAHIVKRRREGWAMRRIAEEVRLAPSTVSRICVEEKCPRKWVRACAVVDVGLVMAWRAQGRPWAMIAADLGFSRAFLMRKVKVERERLLGRSAA